MSQYPPHEAWPEVSLGMESPLGENRGGTPIGERAVAGRALHRQVQRLLRLSEFRFPFSSYAYISWLEA